MDTRSFYYCSYSIGDDAYEDVGEVCRSYGSLILLICGKKSRQAGFARLERALKGTGLSIVAVENYGHDCTYA
jgi:glycerol dehydrogenase